MVESDGGDTGYGGEVETPSIEEALMAAYAVAQDQDAGVHPLVIELQKIQVRTGALEMAARHFKRLGKAHIAEGGRVAYDEDDVLGVAERFLEFMTGTKEW